MRAPVSTELVQHRSAATQKNEASFSGSRVVLVHDWLTGMRGGEKVLEALCDLFPGAPLFTLLHVRGSVSSTIENRQITTSPLQWMPLATTRYRYYLPFFPLFAEMTKAKDCDVVISTSHAVAKAMIARNGSPPPHLCYIHTPMRYVWDRFEDYFGPQVVGDIRSHLFFRPIARALQLYDQGTCNRVDMFVANSRFVAGRVKHIYGRRAEVVAPPINVDRFAGLRRDPEDWYLVVSALAPYKRVEHAIAACGALGKPLKIVGSGPQSKKLVALAAAAGACVEFLGFVSDHELSSYYARARALLFPGVEDFGIVPVEAMAAGCPVVALAKGGVLDSMTDATGVLYTEETVDGLKSAICKFESRSFDPTELRKRAGLFSRDAFVSGFSCALQKLMGRF